eukprot:scaffold133400_cov84-Phaeocystis_antarctica.AAC.1
MASRSRVKTRAHAIGGSSTRLVRQTARVATAAGLSPLPPRAWPCPLLNSLPLPFPAVTMKPVPKSMGLATGVVATPAMAFGEATVLRNAMKTARIHVSPPAATPTATSATPSLSLIALLGVATATGLSPPLPHAWPFP